MNPQPPPLGHVAIAGAVILGLATAMVVMQGSAREFACGPGAIDGLRRAVARADGYTYDVSMDVDKRPLHPNLRIPRVVRGTYAGPARVHERYTFNRMPTRYEEAIRLGDERWVLFRAEWRRHLVPLDRLTDDPWIPVVQVVREHVALPRLVTLPENPALFALDGLLPRPPDYAWTGQLQPGGACLLEGRHVYSPTNGAEHVLTVEVDAASGLPRRIDNVARGFGEIDGASRDWVVVHEFTYPDQVPTIAPPRDVVPFPAGPDLSELATPLPLRPGGAATAQGLRVDLGPVTRVTEYEGITALPGNVFLHAFVRLEGVEGERALSTIGYWHVSTDDLRGENRLWPIAGAPEPYLWGFNASFGRGDVMEGWISMEAPADATVYLYGVDVNSQWTERGYEPGVEVIIAPD